MKKFLLALFLFFSVAFITKLNAQQYFDGFSSYAVGTQPPDWYISGNTKVNTYKRPGTCSVDDKGLLTPAVGKNSPTVFILPKVDFNTASNDIVINFKIFVYDANLNCLSVKDFPCPTYVKAYIIDAAYIDQAKTPPSNQIFAQQPDYQVLNANANNTIIFTNVTVPDGKTQYRLYLDFKSAGNSNCVNNGTKFIFDDFGISSTNCSGTCPPTANADYFNVDAQNLFEGGTKNFFQANLYGGYALWASQAPSGYENGSLSNAPAVSNGTDYDLNNTNLADVTFALVNPSSPLVIESGTACGSNASSGTLIFNRDGTFKYTLGSPCVTSVSFKYTLTTAFGITSETSVIIDLPGQTITLPVHFTSFTASRKQDKVAMKWETASELNNKGFYVQRRTEGEWKDVGFVFSQSQTGNSASGLAYSFTDANAYKGISQYRILQVDLDGTGHFSETRAVQGSAASGKLLLFPNPSATGSVTLVFDSEGTRNVIVTDVSGRIIQQHRSITAGSLNLTNLGSGFYTVQVSDAATGSTTIDKFIVRKL